MPTLDDFELQSEPLRKLRENEILLKPEFWSVDPYARVYPISFGYKLPITMLGSQVAEVLESRNPKYPVGRVEHCSGQRFRCHKYSES